MCINKKNFLILWNPGKYANWLGEIFGDDNVVTSKEDLLKAIRCEEKSYQGIVVLAELNWEGSKYSQFYGIDIAKKILRLDEKTKLPILFVSFMSFKQLLVETDKELPADADSEIITSRLIIGAIGHEFLQLPSPPSTWCEKLDNASPLNDIQFDDIRINLCGVEGSIEGVIHQLQGWFREQADNLKILQDQGEITFNKRFDEIGSLLDNPLEYTKDKKKWNKELAQLISREFSSAKLQNFLIRFCNFVLSLLIENSAERSLSLAFDAKRELLPWKVLLLDDEPNSLKNLKDALLFRRISCDSASTVDQAIDIINRDSYNEIIVTVSDYRLLETVDGIKIHQRKQGYDFVTFISSQDKITHVIALSGMNRKFLLESFQKYPTKVDVYSKDDLYSPDAINLFADTIKDRGNELYETLCSRPLVGEWKSMKPFYYWHRRSTDYRQREQQINNHVRRFINEFKSNLHNQDGTQVKSGIEEFTKLTTGMANKSPQNEEDWEIFQKKLTFRRIALWLNLKEEYSREQIFAVSKGYLSPQPILESKVKKDNTPNPSDKKLEKAMNSLKADAKNLLTTNLALNFPLIELSLLVEEKAWLRAELGSDYYIRKPIGDDGDVSYLVQIGLERFFEIFPDILEMVRNNPNTEKLFAKKGKLTLTEFYMTSSNEAKMILSQIESLVSSPDERLGYKNLLISISKNIKAILSDSSPKNTFLNFLQELLDNEDANEVLQ